MRTDIALLLGAFLGYALLGIYCVLFGVTIWFTSSKASMKISSPIMISLIVVFLMNLIYTVSSTIVLCVQFLSGPDGSPLTSEATFNTAFMFNDLTGTFTTLVADGAIAYRLYVVWQRNWRVLVFPFLCLIGIAGVSTAFVVLDITVIHTHRELITTPSTRLGLAVICITLPFGVYATFMIVGRLWWANRQLKRQGGQPARKEYTNLIIAMIESGSLYTIWMISYIIARFAGDGNGEWLFTSSMPRITGIVATLIYLQRALGYLHPSEVTSTGDGTAQGPLSKIDFTPGRPRNESHFTSTGVVSVGSVVSSVKGGDR